MAPVRIPVYRLAPDVPLPSYAHEGDAGADLYAQVGTTLEAGGGRAIVPTGLVVDIPTGYAGFVQPRSGLALRHGVTCLNTPGLIDAGYRGELSVILVNTDPHELYKVHRGDRIAQLVIQAVDRAVFVELEEQPNPTGTRTERVAGGFGHSGR